MKRVIFLMEETFVDEVYVLVLWPESQDYMEEDWFIDEAILADCEKFGSSAYFIPIKRICNDK